MQLDIVYTNMRLQSLHLNKHRSLPSHFILHIQARNFKIAFEVAEAEDIPQLLVSETWRKTSI